jgi:hypothetical protein
MDPASTLMVSITILKYPLNEGYSDVTINNNLVGEEEIFYGLLCADYLRGYSFGYRLALMLGAIV